MKIMMENCSLFGEGGEAYNGSIMNEGYEFGGIHKAFQDFETD